MSQAIIPYYPDNTKKSRYLSFRVANFTVKESCDLAKCSFTSVKRWREEDSRFSQLDCEGLTDLRKQLADEYLNIEFSRNFRLVLQKDFDILNKSVQGKKLTDEEEKYLLKLRAFYTPQQLVLVKQIIGEASSVESFDFTKLTLTIRREREEILIGARE